MRRRRLLLYAALALAVPVPAFALGLTGSGSSAPASLNAHASLDSCGLFEQQIVCKIDVSFTAIPGADHYAASVTAPNGSVSDYGSVGGGGGSVWVPYVGDGTYTVTVRAFGTLPGSGGHRQLLSKDRASASGGTAARGGDGVSTRRLQGTTQDVAPQSRGDGRFPTDQSAPETTAPSSDQTETTTTTTTPTQPACVPPIPPDPPSAPPAAASGSSDSGSDSAQTLGGDSASSSPPQAQAPASAAPQCPDGTAPTDGGTCCPAPSAP